MLVRQLEEQTLQMREMNQELVDVKQTLSHTQKGEFISLPRGQACHAKFFQSVKKLHVLFLFPTFPHFQISWWSINLYDIIKIKHNLLELIFLKIRQLKVWTKIRYTFQYGTSCLRSHSDSSVHLDLLFININLLMLVPWFSLCLSHFLYKSKST